jgi:beta-ribofuranosylaminobenzene 5'-phosphate synthase
MTESVVVTKNGVNAIGNRVAVTTSARLHMGFFDLNGGLGRRFGSIGLSLKTPQSQVEITAAANLTVEGEGSSRVARIASALLKDLDLPTALHIQIKQAIPEHSGLGSGTQIALAIGMGISEFYQLDLNVNEIALLTQRGARSGVGLGTFAQGGLIVDGGRAAESKVPPVIAHTDFPEDWPILLIFDKTHQGVHGQQEIDAFRNLPEFPAEHSAILCRHVLMQALPALAERDLTSFGAAIRALQDITGDYFAPAQGGTRYTSKRVASVLAHLQLANVTCSGQSSWGPTGFAIFENQSEAEKHLKQLNAIFADHTGLSFVLTQANNKASLIRTMS